MRKCARILILLKSISILCLLFCIKSNAYSEELNPILLKPNFERYKIDTFSKLWINYKHTTTISHALDALKKNLFESYHTIQFPDLYKSGNYDFWILVAVENGSQEIYPLCIRAYGSSGDTVWTLDSTFSIIDSYQFPANNQKRDYTGYLRSAEFDGVAFNHTPTLKYLLFKIRNYRFGRRDLPMLFDARIYESYFYERYKLDIVAYWFYSGLSLALIIFLFVQFIKLKEPHFLWNIVYILILFLPLLDYLTWILSKYIIVPDLWFRLKVFFILGRCVVFYILVDKLLIHRSNVLQVTKNVVIISSVFIFFYDLYLRMSDQLPESLMQFFYSTNFILIAYFALFIILLAQKDTISKILTIGTAVVFGTELYDRFTDHDLGETMQVVGGVLQVFVFGYAYSHKLKIKQNESQLLAEEHKKLQIESAALDMNIRKQIAHDIHDELGSSIAKLSLGLQWAKKNVKDENTLQHTLDQAVTDLNQISDQIREFVFSMNKEVLSIDEFLHQFKSEINSFLEKAEVQFDIQFPASRPIGDISYYIKKQLTSILKECLHNILKHSKATAVTIQLRFVENEYQLFIKDNGIGLPMYLTNKGTGLSSIKYRADLIKATYEINSHDGLEIYIKGPLSINPVSTK